MVGFVFVLIMTATVIFQSCANGLPGWYSGDFAPIGFQDIGAPTCEAENQRLPIGCYTTWNAHGLRDHFARQLGPCKMFLRQVG